MISGRPQRAEDRLRRLLEGTAGRDAVEAGVARRQEAFQAKVTAAARKLGQSLRPSDEVQLGKVRLKLLNAGYRQENAVAVFFGLKALGLLLGLAIAVPAAVMHAGMTQKAMSLAVGGGALGFYLPDFVVGQQKKKRAESIFLGLPDALDLMVVCVEAGLGLDAAMRRVTGELAQSCAGALRGAGHRQLPAPDGPVAQGRPPRPRASGPASRTSARSPR